MIGEGGLGGLIETAGDSFGGSGDYEAPMGSVGATTKQGDGGNGNGSGFDIMKFLPLIGIAAFLLLKKK